MGNNIFLDTHIIVYLLMKNKYELHATDEIFIFAEKEKATLYRSESIIATTFYIPGKEKRIDPLAAFPAMCKPTNVIPFAKNILYSPFAKYGNKEDVLLYFLAYTATIDYFITKNVKNYGFLFPSLSVTSPTNFLKEIYLNDIP